MKKLINLILINVFFSNSLISKDVSHVNYININDPSLIKIKNFLTENKYRYDDMRLYNITKEVDFNFDENYKSLDVYFFKIDDEILVPFITTNFNRFVHKELMLKITKFLYKHIISDVEILPVSNKNSENMKLFSYPNEKELLFVIPLISVKFK